MADLYHLGDGYTVQIKLSRGFPHSPSLVPPPPPRFLPLALAAPRTEHHFILKGILPCSEKIALLMKLHMRRSLRNAMKTTHASEYLIALSYLFPQLVSITTARGPLH